MLAWVDGLGDEKSYGCGLVIEKIGASIILLRIIEITHIWPFNEEFPCAYMSRHFTLELLSLQLWNHKPFEKMRKELDANVGRDKNKVEKRLDQPWNLQMNFALDRLGRTFSRDRLIYWLIGKLGTMAHYPCQWLSFDYSKFLRVALEELKSCSLQDKLASPLGTAFHFWFLSVNFHQVLNILLGILAVYGWIYHQDEVTSLRLVCKLPNQRHWSLVKVLA